jgi:AraC-like DNA-binding protein
VPSAIDTAMFRGITPGIETVSSGLRMQRHRHFYPYATVVLAGRLDESAYSGRISATAGDVLIHPTLDCHANPGIHAGLKIIRLDWSDTTGIGGLYRLDRVDDLARLAERDVIAAKLLLELMLREKTTPSPARKNDWPDLLLEDLTKNKRTDIGVWAEANGLARETVSRGFALAYGIAPSIFRAEMRARAAWLRITRGSDCLCRIAADTGFADQAHMTRWVRRISGAPPAAWRRRSAQRVTGPQSSEEHLSVPRSSQ